MLWIAVAGFGCDAGGSADGTDADRRPPAAGGGADAGPGGLDGAAVTDAAVLAPEVGPRPADATAPEDAAAPKDATAPAPDGSPEQDVGVRRDAGAPPRDQGAPDGEPAPLDQGTPPPDAGLAPPDAAILDGALPSPDADSPDAAPLSPPVVVLGPAAPTTEDELVAAIEPQPDPGLEVTWSWSVDGEPVDIAGPRIPAGRARRGELWRVTATVADALGRRASGAAEVQIGNALPRLAGARPDADPVERGAVVTCLAVGFVDADGDPENVRFTWHDGDPATPPLAEGPRLDTAGFFPDAALVCVARPFDAYGEGAPVQSAPVSVANAPPVVEAVDLHPADPTSRDTLLCLAQASDPDGDAWRFTYTWFVDDARVAAGGPTLAAPPGGSRVRCEATAHDAFATGGSLASADVEIGGAPPRIVRVEVGGPSTAPCAEHRCEVEAVDPDGDPVELTYAWWVDGRVLAGETGAILRRPDLRDGQRVRCEATPAGGEGALSAPRLLVDQPPVLLSASVPRLANVGDRVTCEIAGLSDDCADPPTVRYAWTLDGEPVPGAEGRIIDTSGLAGGLPLVCIATPDDGLRLGAPVHSGPTDLVGSGFGLAGDTAGGLAGQAVAVLDDLDGDGLAEILVGAPNTSINGRTQAGQVYVVYGNEREQTHPLAEVAAGEGGFVIAGEGGSYPLYHDLCRDTGIAGCPRVTPTGDAASRLAYAAGPAGDGLGFQVAGPGDVDGDGVGDLLLGAAYARVADFAYTGKTYVVGGGGLSEAADLALAETAWDIVGECGRRRVRVDNPEDTIRATNGDLASWALDGAGDVNGDGLADLLIGAPNAGNRDQGTAYVVYGAEGRGALRLGQIDARGCGQAALDLPEDRGDALGFGITASGARAYDPHWGRYVSGVGDWDGDGYDDVLVGADQSGDNRSFIVLGAPAQPDVDFDALDPRQNRVVRVRPGFIRSAARRARVCEDGSEPPLNTPCPDGSPAVETIISTQEGALPIGHRGGGGGDVNGDGRSDAAFTMLRGTGDAPFRSVGVLFGGDELDVNYHERAEALDRGLWIEGDAVLDAVGGAVRTNGDLNGDGYDDLVVGLPLDSDAGRVYVAWGGPQARRWTFADLVAGRGGFALRGQQPGERFGWSVDVGDVDGDGLDDLVIGAPYFDTDEVPDAGRVEVVLGRVSDVITQRGTPRDDVLVGGPGRDSIVAGRGDDHVVGGGGPDVLYGGAGDDRIEVADDAFVRVRGGAGFDTLVLAGDASMAEWGKRVEGFERIELAGGAQILRITRRHLLRQSPHTNRLYVDGDAQDTVVSENEAWRAAGEAESLGRTWRVLTSGRAELYLAPEIATRFDPYIVTEGFELPENAPAGTVVGRVEAVDPDGAVDRVELLEGPWSDAFALDDDGVLTVARPEVLDFESAAAVMPLTFRATDAEGLSADGVVEIRLQDVNEAPRFVGVDGLQFEWNEGFYDRELLTALLAVDQDADDVLTWRLVTEDAPFTVDPETGDLYITGALDFEGQPEHVLELEVSDAAGLTAWAAIEVQVLDALTFPQHFALSFVSRGQDLQTPADECWVHPFELNREINRGPGNPATIVDPFAGDGSTLAIDMTGHFEVDWQIQPSRGRLDSAAVTEVVLDLPDEIEPGQPVPVRMISRPRSTAVSGRTPGMLVRSFTIVRDGRLAAWYCSAAAIRRPDLDYDRDCALMGEHVIDPEAPNGESLVFRTEREARPVPFAAVDSEGPSSTRTGDRTDFFEWFYPIESFFDWLLRVNGVLVGPDGLALRYDAGDYQFDLVAFPFYLTAIVRLDLRTRIELAQLGVEARLTLEDGTRVDLHVPTCFGVGRRVLAACLEGDPDRGAQCKREADEAEAGCADGDWPIGELDIPAGADVNGDGRVDVDLSFDLAYDVTQDFDLVWDLGGAAILGEGGVRLTYEADPENPIRITNWVGPLGYAELTFQVNENCPVTTRPRFPTAERRGTLDLRGP